MRTPLEMKVDMLPQREITAVMNKVMEKRVLGKIVEEKPGEDKREILIEDWRAACKRVAAVIGLAEAPEDREVWVNEFATAMYLGQFLPNSPAFGLARGIAFEDFREVFETKTLEEIRKGKLIPERYLGFNASACFVLPLGDSIEEIMETAKMMALVHKSGGGTGIALSRLRPKNSLVRTTNGLASGPVSFLKIFDTLTEEVKQGGTRRGANMAAMNVHHPDILEFIDAKLIEGDFANFNFSVAVTEEFMQAVRDDTDYELRFNGVVYGRISARMVFDRICTNAHTNGDPGIIFIDTINKNSPLAECGEIETTNPCGEEPLHPYGSCTIGSINAACLLEGDWTQGKPATVNWDLLDNIVKVAVRLLDDIITVNQYPIPEINDFAAYTRQIGIGVMGLHDFLIGLHLRYDSEEGLAMSEQLAQRIKEASLRESIALAELKGPCPVFDGQENAPRNGARNCVAPTGTLSILANCSGGIEPYFRFEYVKNCLEEEQLTMIARPQLQWVQAHGEDAPFPPTFRSAGEIDPKWHLAHTAAWQRHQCAGVSKTVNLPFEATVDDVKEIYMKADKLNMKGVTIYRDGSRKTEALTSGKHTREETVLRRGVLVPRPKVLDGVTGVFKTACGKVYVTTNYAIDGPQRGPFEVFARSVTGGCSTNVESRAQGASYELRAGVPPEKVIRGLKSHVCSACRVSKAKGNGTEVKSCSDAIAQGIESAVNACHARLVDLRSEFDENDYVLNPEAAPVATPKPGVKHPCPECGEELNPEAGCVVCRSCGFDRCG